MSYIYNLTDTWNSAGTTFTAIKMNVTDTASAAGSRIIDFQIGGASKLYLDKSGNLVSTGIQAGSLSLTQALGVASGGTGATTASGARVALFPNLTGNGTKVLAVNALTTDVEWISIPGGGSVTSVNASGGSTGLTFGGGPITSSGTLTLGGVLALASGGTGSTTAAGARTNILPSYTANAGKTLAVNALGTDVEWTTSVGGVTSVSGTGTVNGLTLTGTVTGSGSLTLGGTLALTSGQVTTALGFTPYNATNPSGYTSNVGTVTGVTGTAPIVSSGGSAPAISITAATTLAAGSMSAADKIKLDGITSGATANAGTVTSVAGTGTVSGLSLSGTVTSSGSITLGGTLAVTAADFASQTTKTFLAAPNAANGVPTFRAILASDIPTLNQNTTGTAATITGVYSGTITSSQVTTGLGFTPYNATNPSGYTSNAGTVTSVTGTAPIVSSGGNTPAISLADTAVTAGTYTNATLTVDAKGRLTAASSGAAGGTGTVTSVGGTGTVSGLTLSGTVTTTGSLTLGGTLSLTSANVTTALGFTPYNATNPSGYITSSALSGYLPLTGGTLTGGFLNISGTATLPYIDLLNTGVTTGRNYRIRAGIEGVANAGFSIRDQTSGTNVFQISEGGSVIALVDMRAPVFYDSNNTAFYADMASTSEFNTIQTRGGSGVRAFAEGSASISSQLYFANASNTRAWNWQLDENSNAALWNFEGSSWQKRFTFTSGSHFTAGGIITAVVDVRAPVFYDSNNTNYYADPAGTSNFNNLTLNSIPVYRSDWTTRFQSGSDFVNGTLVTTDIPAVGFAGDSFIIEITGKSYGGGPSTKVVAEGYLYNDTIINFAGISYGGPFAPSIKAFEEGGVLKFWWPRISYWNSFNINVMSMDGPTNGTITRNRVTAIGNSTEPTGTKKVTITLATNMRADISATNSADLRAPIFYDSNNTGFYADPASTSNFNQINLGDSTKSIRGGSSGQVILGTGGVNEAYIQVGGSYYSIWNAGNFNPASYLPLSGNAASALRIVFNDGPRDLSDRLPNTFARTVNWDFVGAGTGNGVGNYAGVMTFAPWTGTTASTGDSSYQLAFANQSGVNASGPPRLSIRSGIDTTWGAWYIILTSSNYNDYAPTKTGTGASGSWGINVTGTAGSISGFNNPTTAPTANTIVYRDSIGDIAAREIVLSSGLSSSTPTVLVSMFPTTNQMVRTTPGAVAAAIQGAASGSWGISITGNAATITSQANSATITASTGVTGNHIVQRDGNGYIYASHINFNTSETENPTINSFITGNGDGWSRKSSLAHVKNSIRGVADGTWGINVTGNAATSSGLTTRYDGGVISNPQTYFSSNIGLRVAMTGLPVTWADTLWINGYAGGDVPNMCALHFSRQGTPRMWISSQNNTGTVYGTYYEFPSLGYNSGNTGALHAGSFVDSNDTAFFIDPNSTSNLNITRTYIGARDTNANWNTGFQNTPAFTKAYHGDISSGGPAGSWWFYESMRHSNASSFWGTQIAWGWEDNSNRLFQRNVSGNSFSGWVEYLNTGDRTFTGNLNMTGIIRSTASDMRAPIFYDQNDTAYYVNPNGTSYINALNIGPTASGSSYLNINGYNAYGGTGYHGFLTVYNTFGSATNPQQYWRLNSAGGWEIVNSPYNAVLFTFTQGGDFTAAGNVTAYSDRKLKANFEPISNAVQKVMQLNGVTFTRIDKEDTTTRYAGLLAQDVQPVLPEAVQKNDTMSYGEILSVDYNGTIALLVEAIKEQQEQINELKRKIGE